jgi:hypothetical protein
MGYLSAKIFSRYSDMAALGINGMSYKQTQQFEARRIAVRISAKRISTTIIGGAPTPITIHDSMGAASPGYLAFKHPENSAFSGPETTSKPIGMLTALTLKLVLIPAIVGVIRPGGQALGWYECLVICLSRQRKIIGKHSCYRGTYRHAYRVASPRTLSNLLF